MRLLVTGARGMLGREVAAVAEARAHETIALGHGDLDVTDERDVRAVVAGERPDAIVNCAAFTDVDGAEAAEPEALELNGRAPGLLAAAASATAAQLIHVSTDYVFDGAAARPYLESDPVRPQSAYGRSKLAGELAVRAAGPQHAVARTAWLFGTGGRNFVATMLALADSGQEEVAVVTDQVGSPTFAGHLASALVDIAERRLAGVRHTAGAGACSWNELARAAFAQAGLACTVKAVTSDHFPRPAKRPAWSVLASERADTPRLPSWEDGLKAYLAETREGLPRR
ncbi:MAG TPA: dTDP-4-dehydrorhamnose reductase [Solirubrobacteraceae bacterium]|nr:dTDP-4-dehydrorhamnose reductase [Solirubrobacteraceae bacterium]